MSFIFLRTPPTVPLFGVYCTHFLKLNVVSPCHKYSLLEKYSSIVSPIPSFTIHYSTVSSIPSYLTPSFILSHPCLPIPSHPLITVSPIPWPYSIHFLVVFSFLPIHLSLKYFCLSSHSIHSYCSPSFLSLSFEIVVFITSCLIHSSTVPFCLFCPLP